MGLTPRVRPANPLAIRQQREMNMRSIFHTRPLGTVPIIASALIFGACASSGGGPIYELRPTDAPLTYRLSSEGSNDVETPSGSQGSTYSADAVLTLQVGQAVQVGRTFTATIEAYSFETAGDFGGMSDDITGDVAGKPFQGVIGADGDVTFTSVPEFAKGRMTTRDLERVLSGLVFPLPPGGDPAVGSWPHRVTLPPGGGMEGNSVYEGTASMAGDTLWNGITAAVIVSEGVANVEGRGQPEGAPAEIELATELAARTVYIWDPARGVLLEVRASASGGGDVTTMGFSMPMTVGAESIMTLQP